MNRRILNSISNYHARLHIIIVKCYRDIRQKILLDLSLSLGFFYLFGESEKGVIPLQSINLFVSPHSKVM